MILHEILAGNLAQIFGSDSFVHLVDAVDGLWGPAEGHVAGRSGGDRLAVVEAQSEIVSEVAFDRVEFFGSIQNRSFNP